VLLLAVAAVSLIAGRWEAGLVTGGFASPLAVGAFLFEVLRTGGRGDQEDRFMTASDKGATPRDDTDYVQGIIDTGGSLLIDGAAGRLETGPAD
jgi:hypothetical protein